jgi:hypothetical protein
MYVLDYANEGKDPKVGLNTSVVRSGGGGLRLAHCAQWLAPVWSFWAPDYPAHRLATAVLTLPPPPPPGPLQNYVPSLFVFCLKQNTVLYRYYFPNAVAPVGSRLSDMVLSADYKARGGGATRERTLAHLLTGAPTCLRTGLITGSCTCLLTRPLARSLAGSLTHSARASIRPCSGVAVDGDALPLVPTPRPLRAHPQTPPAARRALHDATAH